MAHESQPTPERREQYRDSQPTFNLNNFPPDQVAELFAMFGDKPYLVRRDADPALKRRARLYMSLVHDIENFPAQDPAKAYDLYMTMVTSEELEAQRVVAQRMGQLLQQYPEPSDERQRIIDVWMALFQRGHQADPVVEATAIHAVEDAIRSDWLDEPTARYLDSQLPPRDADDAENAEEYEKKVWRSEG